MMASKGAKPAGAAAEKKKEDSAKVQLGDESRAEVKSDEGAEGAG